MGSLVRAQEKEQSHQCRVAFFMMYKVYIIYSAKLIKFYIGTTDDFESRFMEHHTNVETDAFTYRGRPWEQFLIIDNLTSKQAYSIEAHIKAMKSKKYIENLKKYPAIIEKLKMTYS